MFNVRVVAGLDFQAFGLTNKVRDATRSQSAQLTRAASNMLYMFCIAYYSLLRQICFSICNNGVNTHFGTQFGEEVSKLPINL